MILIHILGKIEPKISLNKFNLNYLIPKLKTKYSVIIFKKIL